MADERRQIRAELSGPVPDLEVAAAQDADELQENLLRNVFGIRPGAMRLGEKADGRFVEFEESHPGRFVCLPRDMRGEAGEKRGRGFGEHIHESLVGMS